MTPRKKYFSIIMIHHFGQNSNRNIQKISPNFCNLEQKKCKTLTILQKEQEKDEKIAKKFLTWETKCDIIPKVNRILGYSQAVRHQTLTLAFSLVRIQLSQPKISSDEVRGDFYLFTRHSSLFTKSGRGDFWQG